MEVYASLPNGNPEQTAALQSLVEGTATETGERFFACRADQVLGRDYGRLLAVESRERLAALVADLEHPRGTATSERDVHKNISFSSGKLPRIHFSERDVHKNISFSSGKLPRIHFVSPEFPSVKHSLRAGRHLQGVLLPEAPESFAGASGSSPREGS